MLKKNLTASITDRLSGFYKRDVDNAVGIVLETIAQAMADGRRVEIRGFGSFSARKRRARKAANPRTGQIMHISSRKNIHFIMRRALKEKMMKKA